MASKRSHQPKRARAKTHRVMCLPETPAVVKGIRLDLSNRVGRVLNQDEMVDALIRAGALHLDQAAEILRSADPEQGEDTP